MLCGWFVRNHITISCIQHSMHLTFKVQLSYVIKPSKETYSENKRIKIRQIYKYSTIIDFYHLVAKPVLSNSPPVSQASRASPRPLCNVVPYMYLLFLTFPACF